MSNQLVIDISSCNNIIGIFEEPLGSGKYKASFEVKRNNNINNKIQISSTQTGRNKNRKTIYGTI
jgi:hypothetical protein